MPETHLKFHSTNGKRRILVVEDEMINREILKMMLQDTYELVIAETGTEALQAVRDNGDTLSLVLLDLNLPDMHGLDVLKQIKATSFGSRIPVIVMTSETEAEVESLTLGAIDFIPKPYPQPKVVLARALRTIELSEDRDTIRFTERDQLTGLYNREYFYRYAAQFDLYHKELPTDAVEIDIRHFHIINDRYGRAYGDEILKRVGEKIRETVQDADGIVCRRTADSFLVYCLHREDYADLLENASIAIEKDGKSANRIRLRMGIYSNTDKSMDIERRFDRAKLAMDTIKGNYTKSVGFYDDSLHEKELFIEQLIEDFPTAIREHQFCVYYQPKFDIRGDKPVLSSAEALVRWKHPEIGMVNPGIFIPLFEGNGMIQELDFYVWEKAGEQMRKWREETGISIPVSVNVSRVDLYEPGLIARLQKILHENGLKRSDLILEVTESAYTEDSQQIIEVVRNLREYGYRIEMDDFGSGYSSLNMLSTLPIDGLKLDMAFIRNAFRERKDTRLLEAVIALAGSLDVITIAEGVETAEQMMTLKSMGCDFAQGYFFSRPLPADEFERFLKEKQPEKVQSEKEKQRAGYNSYVYDSLHDSLTGLYNESAFEILLRDADKEHIAVVIARVDHYTGIREIRGKGYADQLIRRISDVLKRSFRSADSLSRLKEDEFAVIMTRVTYGMRDIVFEKLAEINRKLDTTEGEIGAASLSVGIAFSDHEKPGADLFADADAALQRAMQAGKGNICEA